MKKQSKTKRPAPPDRVKMTTNYLEKLDRLIDSTDQREALQRRFEMLMETTGEDHYPAMIQAMQLLRKLRPDEPEFAERGIREFVEFMADDMIDTDPEIQRIRKEIDHLEKNKYELEDDEYYPIDEMPNDLRELNDQWGRRSREIQADILRQFGEDALADFYLDDEAYKVDLEKRVKEIRAQLDSEVTDTHGPTEVR